MSSPKANPKKESPPRGPTITLPTCGFARAMLFNKFSIVEDGDFRLLNFGYVTAGNVIVDHFLCAMHVLDVHAQRTPNLDYMAKIGPLSVPAPELWTPPPTNTKIELINMLGLVRTQTLAEIVMYRMSLKAAVDISRNIAAGTNLKADAIAILRSTADLQQHFVKSLYA